MATAWRTAAQPALSAKMRCLQRRGEFALVGPGGILGSCCASAAPPAARCPCMTLLPLGTDACACVCACRVAAIGAGWVELDRELPFPVQPGWTGAVHRDAPTLVDAGIEQLTIEFK